MLVNFKIKCVFSRDYNGISSKLKFRRAVLQRLMDLCFELQLAKSMTYAIFWKFDSTGRFSFESVYVTLSFSSAMLLYVHAVWNLNVCR